MLVVKNKKYPTLAEQFFNGDLPSFFGSDFQSNLPQVNIIENEKEYQIELAVPGLNKEDMQVKIESNMLTVHAEKKEETEVKKENYLKKEFSYKSFTRRFKISEKVDNTAIKAVHENGVLRLILPKKERKDLNNTKTITIS